MQQITILIVDDHRLIRETWSYILNSHPSFKVIGLCETGEEGVQKATELQPEIVIMDINLPGISGVEATAQITQSGCPSKILGLSLNSEPKYAHIMMERGAMGYITKNSPTEEIYEAILEIQKGRKYVCKEIKSNLSKSPDIIDSPNKA